MPQPSVLLLKQLIIFRYIKLFCEDDVIGMRNCVRNGPVKLPVALGSVAPDLLPGAGVPYGTSLVTIVAPRIENT